MTHTSHTARPPEILTWIETLRRTKLLMTQTTRLSRTAATQHLRRFPYGQRFHRWHTLHSRPPHRPGR
ncbi:hypothetical protein [Streptomyces sp. NPDC058268]|uniref:hypothetical protein n=1 Tax=Streptomyces sp. NPDC058268 TaxID=3346413 RepID=UPI0036EFDB3A